MEVRKSPIEYSPTSSITTIFESKRYVTGICYNLVLSYFFNVADKRIRYSPMKMLFIRFQIQINIDEMHRKRILTLQEVKRASTSSYVLHHAYGIHGECLFSALQYEQANYPHTENRHRRNQYTNGWIFFGSQACFNKCENTLAFVVRFNKAVRDIISGMLERNPLKRFSSPLPISGVLLLCT